ncbi:MAG TPA: hypothetical protein VFX84_01200, partial [Candidatus Saccharimonadales bacterium]|nr:hypothetical protein [Candidatus Saccharimonadales bacterium]
MQRHLRAQAAQRAGRMESALGREFHRIAAAMMGSHVLHEPLVLADERGGVPASILEPPAVGTDAAPSPTPPPAAPAPPLEPVDPVPAPEPIAPAAIQAPVSVPPLAPVATAPPPVVPEPAVIPEPSPAPAPVQPVATEPEPVPVTVVKQPPVAEPPAESLETPEPQELSEALGAPAPQPQPEPQPVASEVSTPEPETLPDTTAQSSVARTASAEAQSLPTLPEADESLESGNELENDPFSAAVQPPEDETRPRKGFSPFNLNRAALMVTSFAMVIIMLIGGLSFMFIGRSGNQAKQTPEQKVSGYAVGSKLSLSSISSNPQLEVGQADSLSINGQLKVADSLVLAPTTAPAQPQTGEIYFDQNTKAPAYYNGSDFISLAPQPFPQHVASIGGSTGVINLDNSLSVVNNQLAVADSVLQRINGISTSYVRSLKGTANQVTVSSSTGNVTLSLPQSIAASSTPTFGGLTLNGQLTVTSGGADITGSVQLGSLGLGLVQSDAAGLLSSGTVDRNDPDFFTGTLSIANGGTGSSSFTANGILYGNGSGTILATNSLADATLVTDGSGVPSLSQTLPLQVQDNITHTGVLISGSINNGFGAISTTNNITTTALVQAGSLEVFGGSFTVDGSGNITADGSATIRGSGGLTIGVAGTTSGSLNLADASNNTYITTVQAIAQAGQNQTIYIPASSAATDTVCLLTLGNCFGSGSSVTATSGTQNYITKFTNAAGNEIGNSLLYDNGVSVGVGTATPGASYLLDINGALNVSGTSDFNDTLTITSGGASVTGDITQVGAGAFSTGTGAVSLNGATTVTGSNTFTVGTGAATFGGTVDVTSGLTTLSGGLSVSNGATIVGATNINVSGTANTFIGNATGTFGLTSAGLSVTTGGALSGITGYTQASGNFAISGTGTFSTGTGAISLNGTTTVADALNVNGGSLTVGVAGTTVGNIYLANNSSTRQTILRAVNPTGAGDAIIEFPSIAGGSTDTVCLQTLNNCAFSGSAAGGDLTGTYPNPTIASLQGTTLTLSGLASGDVLQYNGSAIVNGHIT